MRQCLPQRAEALMHIANDRGEVTVAPNEIGLVEWMTREGYVTVEHEDHGRMRLTLTPTGKQALAQHPRRATDHPLHPGVLSKRYG